MDILKFYFPVSGIETYLFIPPLVAFMISFFTSMGGISGAFLILPFQMSVLGVTSLSVSSTNFLYNVVGTPGGILRYMREKRLVWPLAGAIISGALPGVLIGYYLRVKYLPDPKAFKFFVGLMLMYVGFRLLRKLNQGKTGWSSVRSAAFSVTNLSYSLRRIEYTFGGDVVSFSPLAVFSFALIVGIIGGIYGIGGGAIIAPICVSVLNIPVFTMAGAVLTGNFFTSLAGIFFYNTIPFNNGYTVPADWLLGFLFGVGGILGMYLGAKSQRLMPEKTIKLFLASAIFIVSGSYILQYILR